MDFQLTEEQKMLRASVADFIAKRVAPTIASLEEGASVPPGLRKEMADLGVLGLCLPAEYGGSERPALDAMLVIELLAPVSFAVGVLVMEANTGPGRIIEKLGSPELRTRTLPSLLAGEIIIAPSMTEPEAGSALTDLQTKARLVGGEYVINGRKLFQHADADYFLLFARFTEERGARGIGAVLVSKDSPGFSWGSPQEFMGMKSPRSEMVLDNCRVPEENLVVRPGDFKKLIGAFNLERCGNAACSVGVAQKALDLASGYAQQRKQFGKAICDFQGIQFMLADMAMKVEAARLLVHRAAANAGRGFPAPLETSLAKCFANEIVREVSSMALQIHGGYGYTTESEIERIFRDSWGWGIGGGTIQMHKIIIASELLGRRFNLRM
ncbi:MAG: acyl-CoA dehydrogenase family protein [Chloroflexota bacterium]